MHYFGTIASALVLVWAVATAELVVAARRAVLRLRAGLVRPFFIEKNKPATFEAPLWSLISDWRMCGLWLSGRLGHELMKHQIRG